jgi:hypothetical protein
MEVLLQGKLTNDQDMREVLEDVLSLPGSTVGVFRISAPGENLNGRLVLYNRRYVIGANISDSPESGYAAVRRLLSVRDGNFAFMESHEDAPQTDSNHPVCLDLQALLEYLPELPETLPGSVEAHDVLPASEVAVEGLRDAIEAVRQATTSKSGEMEAISPAKMRQMKRGIRWSKVAAMALVLGVLAAGVNYSLPYTTRVLKGIMAKFSQPAAAKVSPPAADKPAVRSKRRHRHH